MNELDKWTDIRLAEGETQYERTERLIPKSVGLIARNQKLGKVWVTEETKAILQMIGEKHKMEGGPSLIAALLIEELASQRTLEQVFQSHRNRRRRLLYHMKYG